MQGHLWIIADPMPATEYWLPYTCLENGQQCCPFQHAAVMVKTTQSLLFHGYLGTMAKHQTFSRSITVSAQAG